MLRRSVISAALASALAIGLATPAAAQTEIQWWHSMGGNLGEWVNDQAKGFNESQKEYKVVPVFKGSYDESMTAAIAAFRAGNAPHILQVFEVGTATMMASKGRDQAGARLDERGRLQVRSRRRTCPQSRATTPRRTVRC